MYLFFLQREKEHQASQSTVTGRRDLLPVPCFGFPVLPHPAPERSVVGLERTAEATLLALGQAQPGVFGPSFPQALFMYPPSSAGLALGTRHCVLGDSLTPNSPGNSGSSGFQGHFQCYSSGKTFAICLTVCSDPWLLVESAFCWLPPLCSSHEPTDQEFLGPVGPLSSLCLSP